MYAEAAQIMIDQHKGDAKQALSKALAFISGTTKQG